MPATDFTRPTNEARVQVRARFRPHPRGFGFLTPVTADGVTPTTVGAEKDDGTTKQVDRVFVPPPTAKGLVADDLVDAEMTLDDKGASAEAVTLVERARRMLVGTVQRGPGRLVLEPDADIGTGWIDLEETLAGRLGTSIGRQIVVLCGDREDGTPVGRALVAGPHVVGSPAAIRANAVVVAMGRSAPTLVPGGAVSAGLSPAEAATTHTRVVGLLAGGRRGAAAGLGLDGPIPGAELPPADARDEPCVSVDDATTRDIDDAVGAWWDGDADAPVYLAVHIADVAAVVGMDSPADHYARTVASTAYLAVGDNAPMIDPALSEGDLSLLPGADRRAISVRFRVEPDGTVADVHVDTAVVRSRAKLTYAAVEDWLAGDAGEVTTLAGEHADDASAILTAAVEASRRLGVERDARATFEDLFEQAEIEPAVVEGKLTVRDTEPHVQAYRLIERLMVAANEGVAGWLVEHDVPALYRAHEGVDPDRAGKLQAAAEAIGASLPALEAETSDADAVMGQVIAEIERLGSEGRAEDRDLLVAAATASTARANYDTDPTHHRGLAASAYCHFTSPIRRYADLVVHRQIRSVLAEEEPLHRGDTLASLAVWLDTRSGALKYLQARERNELWARLLDRGFLDAPEPAVVTGINAAGLKIRLPRLGLTGFVTAERALGLPARERGKLEVDASGLSTTSGPWRLGTRVKVRMVGLDDTNRPIFRLGDTAKR